MICTPRECAVLATAALIAAAGCRSGTPPPAPPAAVAPDVASPLARGRERLARGDMAAAATAFRQALRAEPDLVDARAGLGLALYGLGDLDAAVDELRAALRVQPDAVAARLALARVLVARQEWPAARDELERVVAAHPDAMDAQYALGIVRYLHGDVGGALESYRRVLAVDPGQPDAHYNLALLLTLSDRHAEATPEFVAAGEAGHARAQYFAGVAYATGLGVQPDLATAVTWWFRAAEQGVPEAEEVLAELRQLALGRIAPRARGPGDDRSEALAAFQEYRRGLWKEFPGLTPGDTVGGALLDQGRVREAVPVLIREAGALSEPAQRLLEALYEHGLDGRLPAGDPRILGYLQRAAAEGRLSFPAAR